MSKERLSQGAIDSLSAVATAIDSAIGVGVHPTPDGRFYVLGQIMDAGSVIDPVGYKPTSGIAAVKPNENNRKRPIERPIVSAPKIVETERSVEVDPLAWLPADFKPKGYVFGDFNKAVKAERVKVRVAAIREESRQIMLAVSNGARMNAEQVRGVLGKRDDVDYMGPARAGNRARKK